MNNIWQRTFHFKGSIELFLDLLTLWPYSLTKPDFFRLTVIFQACSLLNDVGDPSFFYISDISKSSTLSGKSLRKESMLENFRANVLKCLYTSQIRARALIGQSAMVNCACKLMEKSRVLGCYR